MAANIAAKLWTPQEAADYWRIKVDTVYRAIRARRIMHIPVGREYRIPHEQILKGMDPLCNSIPVHPSESPEVEDFTSKSDV